MPRLGRSKYLARQRRGATTVKKRIKDVAPAKIDDGMKPNHETRMVPRATLDTALTMAVVNRMKVMPRKDTDMAKHNADTGRNATDQARVDRVADAQTRNVRNEDRVAQNNYGKHATPAPAAKPGK